MDRGLFIAASGMLAEQVRQDMLANDLANATTPGYKADRAAQGKFGDLLVSDRVTGRPLGTIGAGVRILGQTTDLSAADLKSTEEPLDMAVQGEGFFAVRTAQGERYTRNGRFTALPDGTLGDAQGNQVLGPDRRPVQVRTDGTVPAEAVGIFAITGATKEGDNLFTGQPGGTPSGRVVTGALEISGAQPARTMVDMLASMRAFEAGQRAITTIDETMRLSSQQLGSLPG